MSENTPIPKGSTRREFLKKAIKFTVASGVGSTLFLADRRNEYKLKENNLSFVPSSKRVSDQLNQPVHDPVPNENIGEVIEHAGLRVVLNKDGLPIKLILTDGKEIPFSLEKVLKIKEKAKTTNEPELIRTIELLPWDSDYPQVVQERSIDHKLPDDTLTENELKLKGVTIIQDDDFELHIRKKAFEDGGLLSSAGDNHDSTLKIVLCPGSVLDPYFIQGKKYDSVRQYLKPPAFNPGVAREAEVASLKQEIDKMTSLMKDGQTDIEVYFRQLAKAKAFIECTEGTMPDAHVIAVHLNKNSDLGNGMRGRYLPEKNIAYTTVGDSELDTRLAWFYFLPDGSFDFEFARGGERINGGFFTTALIPSYFISSFDSCPDPTKFRLNAKASRDDSKSYPYGGQSPGFVLRHELSHFEMLTGNKSHSNKNEYDTDMRAMETIRNAWDTWQQSDRSDSSGYYFVFQNKELGETILT